MGRQHQHWQQREPEQYLTWHPVEPPQAVEGPLALEFFRDRTLVLELAPHQLAFREQDGQLKQVYFDGLHELSVGLGPGMVDPASRLFFLRGDVPIVMRWREGCTLRVDAGQEPGILVPLRGVCSVIIDDPATFHRTVLEGLEELDPGRLVEAVDTLVRSQLESRLASLVENGSLDPMRVEILLNDLAAWELDEDLLELGLRCFHLAAGTPAVRREPASELPTENQPVGSYDDVF
jgi:hypothetical protein